MSEFSYIFNIQYTTSDLYIEAVFHPGRMAKMRPVLRYAKIPLGLRWGFGGTLCDFMEAFVSNADGLPKGETKIEEDLVGALRVELFREDTRKGKVYHAEISGEKNHMFSAQPKANTSVVWGGLLPEVVDTVIDIVNHEIWGTPEECDDEGCEDEECEDDEGCEDEECEDEECDMVKWRVTVETENSVVPILSIDVPHGSIFEAEAEQEVWKTAQEPPRGLSPSELECLKKDPTRVLVRTTVADPAWIVIRRNEKLVAKLQRQ